MGEIKNFEAGPEKKKQIIEGVIGKNLEGWKEKLPVGILPEMVDTILESDGVWFWHLKPEFIKDEEEKKRYQDEKEQWDASG